MRMFIPFIRGIIIRRRWSIIVLLPLILTLNACTSWFFYPQRPHIQTPANLGFQYQDIYLNTPDDERIHAWLIEPKLAPDETPAGTVYFLHGNAQNISWHIFSTPWLLQAGYRVFAIDYRGYGASTGVPNIPEVYQDIDAGFEWLQANLQQSADHSSPQPPLILFGQSLGASLSLNWLGRTPEAQSAFSHVLVESGFSRFDTVAKEVASNHWLTWLFQYPAKWFLADEDDPADAIAELTMPIMIVHSTDDSVVNFSHALVLQEAGGPNTQLTTATGSHISAFGDANTQESVLSWLANGR